MDRKHMGLEDIPKNYNRIDLPETIKERRDLINSFQGRSILVWREQEGYHEGGRVKLCDHDDDFFYLERGSPSSFGIVRYEFLVEMQVAE